MKLIDLPDGGKGWVCDQVEWAIFPEREQELDKWFQEQSALYEKLYGERPSF